MLIVQADRLEIAPGVTTRVAKSGAVVDGVMAPPVGVATFVMAPVMEMLMVGDAALYVPVVTAAPG